MKAIIVMFDSLNRHMLPPYGDKECHASNFARLAEKTVTFDQSYVCSMPCMPARRDFHTGRPNFLHRSWSPLEPFDESVPLILDRNKIHTHLTTDHYHYFEDEGSTYHTKYSSWEFFRGQESDPWHPIVGEPPLPEEKYSRLEGIKSPDDVYNPEYRMYMNNYRSREAFNNGYEMPQKMTFDSGLEFLERNHEKDNWMLTIETFDPHEPFVSDEVHKEPYKDHYDQYKGPEFDWPPYQTGEVTDSEEIIEHCRTEYKSTLNQCDHHLGRVLDFMDKNDMWKDTMLVVWTDHGFLLGEHNHWAKVVVPLWDEIAHTPFFVWDPRSGCKGERRSSLVQPSIDLGPTLLDFFGIEPTPHMTGKVLTDTIAKDTPVRDAAIFGFWGGQINITDGEHLYMRAPDTTVTCYQYTLMPTHMNRQFATAEFKDRISIHDGFPFTDGCPVLKIGDKNSRSPEPTKEQRKEMTTDKRTHDFLYNMKEDPKQLSSMNPEEHDQVIAKLENHICQLFAENDAPEEIYERFKVKNPSLTSVS